MVPRQHLTVEDGIVLGNAVPCDRAANLDLLVRLEKEGAIIEGVRILPADQHRLGQSREPVVVYAVVVIIVVVVDADTVAVVDAVIVTRIVLQHVVVVRVVVDVDAVVIDLLLLLLNLLLDHRVPG